MGFLDNSQCQRKEIEFMKNSGSNGLGLIEYFLVLVLIVIVGIILYTLLEPQASKILSELLGTPTGN